jgi:hypothetical protein
MQMSEDVPNLTTFGRKAEFSHGERYPVRGSTVFEDQSTKGGKL